MSAWEEIVNAALIGTERQQFTLPAQSAKLDELLAQMQSESRERTLLSAAAATTLYQRAGRLPQKAKQSLPEPCIEGDLPRCNARSAQPLSLMLAGEHKEVLPEWLAALAQAGKRVPEDALPKLLDLGKAQEHWRDAIIAVIGNRGEWLAAQNPEWGYVVGTLDESLWETGSFEMRLALLKKLRASEPARARELVASTWSAESPDARAAFIAAFQIGLSLDDEPFLEAALDDRRKEVRRTAADMLARLPESALVKRMIERVQPLISFKRKLLGKDNIEITLPVACDKAMQRDGVEIKPPHKSVGEKAWWLQQMLGAISPQFWCVEFNKTALELTAAAGNGNWRSILICGWATATARYGDLLWSEILIEELLKNADFVSPEELFILLPPEQREMLALKTLNHNYSLHSLQPANWMLKLCTHRWSEALSLEVLSSLSKCFKRREPPELWGAGDVMNATAPYFNPNVSDKAAQILTDSFRDDEYWSATIQRFLSTLQFRYDMLKEINA
ncbi:MAG TPA: DUF5691 domain-containing protein [Blastocatellia bacterium]|nr:DUF5691 domain-containing protein [Blastocatellia bacterium]